MAPLRIEEQRSWQAARSHCPHGLGSGIKQNIRQVQALAVQVILGLLCAFALVDQNEGDVRKLRLSLLKHRHLAAAWRAPTGPKIEHDGARSEEHTSELQSLMRISYAVF